MSLVSASLGRISVIYLKHRCANLELSIVTRRFKRPTLALSRSAGATANALSADLAAARQHPDLESVKFEGGGGIGVHKLSFSRMYWTADGAPSCIWDLAIPTAWAKAVGHCPDENAA